jgi:hypothetical protein
VTSPSVGRVVHYVSYGTPGGEFSQQCRAAVVTEVDGAELVSLAVFNPTGVFFNRRCEHAEPVQQAAGRVLTGGTWHWPERV